MGIPVVYLDEDVLVVSKPPGLSVIPERYGSAAHSLKNRLEEGYGRLFVVHRLDKETSGLVIFARDADAHRFLCEEFEHHRVRKTYEALAAGDPPWNDRIIDLPLRIDAGPGHRTIVDRRGGKPASTRFVVAGKFRGYVHFEVYPTTGRTHQVRVHAAALGLPLVCDDLYGRPAPLLLSDLKPGFRGGREVERPLLDRLALHASGLALVHPRSGTPMEFSAPRWKDFEVALRQLGKWR